MPKEIRAFFALEIKNPHVIKKIGDIQDKLVDLVRPLRIKTVEPENIHLTMRFLGNISEDTARNLYYAMEHEINEVFFAEGTLEFDVVKLDDFKNRIFFVDLRGNTKILHDMKKKLESIVVDEFNFKPDRKFRTHITIGRLKKYRGNKGTNKRFPYQQYADLKKEYEDEVFGSVEFDKLHLKKSTLTPKGPIYDSLKFD